MAIFEADLAVPGVVRDVPAPGRRARVTAPEYVGTEVHHLLYLPIDWAPGRTYPVIVEYAGNGPFRSRYGDVSTGEVAGSNLGYGISAGRGFIWLCLPFVNEAGTQPTPVVGERAAHGRVLQDRGEACLRAVRR